MRDAEQIEKAIDAMQASHDALIKQMASLREALAKSQAHPVGHPDSKDK